MFMEKYEPKILIGSPIYEEKEYCRKEFVENVKRFTYKNANFLMVDNSKGTSYLAKLRRDGVPATRVPRGRNSRDAVANACNELRKRVMQGEYEFLLMLESDVFPPPDIIERLLKYADVESPILQKGRRVVGAPYHIGIEKKSLCIFVPQQDEPTGLWGTKLLPLQEQEAFLSTGLRRVHGMGVGCTLIHRSIIERFPFWYSELDDDRMYDQQARKHPDVYFYVDLHNNGIPVFCDTDSYVIHQPSDWRRVKGI